MGAHKIHFSYEPNKPDIEAFAQTLIQPIGQTPYEDAEEEVVIGGDGSLLHAFRKAEAGRKLFGLVPPNTNSRGFWTNHGITNAEMLLDALGAAQGFKINPLKAELHFQDGSSHILRAFNEFLPAENSGQAMLVNLSIKHAGNTIGPIRLMGDGLIIATAFGSTAINRTYGGPAIDIRNSGTLLSGKGIYEPQGGFAPISASDSSYIKIDFLSPKKRPVRLLYDGQDPIISDPQNPFTALHIQKDMDHAIELLLTEDPATRAFSALIPR